MQDIRSTRRSFLKAGAALGGLAIAPRAIVEAQAADPQTLSWLCYPGHAAPEVIGPFEQQNNVKILAKEYSGGEKMMALINGSPPGAFDVVTSDEAYVSELIKADYIEQLNPADFPLGEFWPDFQKFPLHWVDGKLYSIMTSWGANGLIYNADKLSADDASSYAIMWDPRLKGKLGMRDWYLPCMGCVSLAMGNKPKPYDIDNAKFATMLAKMNALKPSVVGFWDFAGEFDSFANGNAWVVPGSGEWMAGLLQKDGHNVLSSVPKEGAVIWTESACIVTGTKKADLAKEFIRYLVSPEGQRRLMLKTSYMASGPSKVAWENLNKADPKMAKVLRMDLNGENLLSDWRGDRLVLRQLPTQQSPEDWQEAWSKFQNM